MSHDRLIRAVERGELGGVFFLAGDEEFLKEEVADRLVTLHLEGAPRDFNFDQLRGADLEPETLASLVQTPPLMSEWRVVVVREAQHLAASARLRSIIETLLERPPAGLALILMTQIPSGSKAQFYDRLKRDARAVEFNALSAADLPGWLMERAAAEGWQIEPTAARALATAIGSSMGVLISELAKLREFVGERKLATAADVAAVAGHLQQQHNRWDWFDTVGEGRWRDARKVLPNLLDAGEAGVVLVLGLGTHFLRLAMAASGGAKALEAELPPNQRWLASRIERQSRRWTLARLNAVLTELLRADRLFKSTSLTEEQVMGELLLRLERISATAP
jgi:DNA polymerase-3 subunit delta